MRTRLLRGCYLFALLIVATGAFAAGPGQPLLATQQEALAVAQNWTRLGQELGWGWNGDSPLTESAVRTLSRDAQHLAYCIEVPGGGWVVVPVCQDLPPITAYSGESSLDVSQDDGMVGMLKDVLSYKLNLVRSLLGYTTPPDEWLPLVAEIEANRTLWRQYQLPYAEFTAALEAGTPEKSERQPGQVQQRYGIDDIGPFCQTSWDQNSPYYNLCPMGDGGRCVVGCVATACSQIIAFWRYPASGTGTHSYYWNGDQSCGGSTSGATLSATYTDAYDWANILNSYSGGETQAQKDAVAELCYEVGVALDMDYGACGSGAYTADVMEVLTSHFGYSSNVDRENRSSYSTAAQWFAMLQEDLNNNRPMQYRIYAHSIVCDGWRVSGTNQIHLNYGWDDSHNAWYTVDNLYCSWSGCDRMEEYAIRRIYPANYITVTAPNGGETWYTGETRSITWTSTGVSGNVKIELNRTYPTGGWETLFASTSNDGSESWPVSGTVTTAARVRITSVSVPTITDVSNADCAIASPFIAVSVPNGGEMWMIGDVDTIRWTSGGLSETVRIQVNRTYPSASWTDIVASTANDGAHPWTVDGSVSSTTRIRIIGITHPSIGDTSNANFSIVKRTVTVNTPNGGETAYIGAVFPVSWSYQYVTGYVQIELCRDFPSGNWDPIVLIPCADCWYEWPVSTFPTTTARIRIKSVTYPSVGDTSNNNFTIASGNQPPVIAHDPLHDQILASFVVTAEVTDDAGGFTTRFKYHSYPSGAWDSLALSSTGNPDEYSVTVGALSAGLWEYFLCSIDAQSATTTTDTFRFAVGAACTGEDLIYDDGTAESSHWGTPEGYKWAVRFDPPAPYTLCQAYVGISGVHPDSAHSQILVEVLSESGGLPGSVLWSRTVGTVGNVIGGVPASPESYAYVVLRDSLGNALQMTGSFFVAVSNPTVGKYEAFLHDTSSTRQGHSYVYDPCEETWYSDLDAEASCRAGNRMIRVGGYGLAVPTRLTAVRSGNDLQLRWNSTGAPLYRIYSATVPAGPYGTLEGTATDTSFVDVNVFSTSSTLFYEVRAVTE